MPLAFYPGISAEYAATSLTGFMIHGRLVLNTGAKFLLLNVHHTLEAM